jgi:very-short-patch-repair endonuclease
MIPYIGEECAKTHTSRSKYEIYPTCPDCGRISNKKVKICDIYKCNGFSCSCSDGISYPNKFMYNILEQLGIEFETEYSPEWISPRRYDFYIPSMNLIIEMDGGLGHGKKVRNKNNKTAKDSIKIDDYKDNQAREQGIEVVRIDSDYDNMKNRFKYIKNNILTNKKLNELFDLDNIDWNKCNEFACYNLIKIASEYKNNNPNMTTTKIGVLMKYTQNSIINWLKIGNDMNWCDYDTQKEIKISLEKGWKAKKEI